MSNPNGRKGAMAETQAVEYLRANGFPEAERRVTNGAKDRGDIGGIASFVGEVKNEKTIALSQYLKELAVEMENADADFGACIVKRRNASVKDWYWVMSFEERRNVDALHPEGGTLSTYYLAGPMRVPPLELRYICSCRSILPQAGLHYHQSRRARLVSA